MTLAQYFKQSVIGGVEYVDVATMAEQPPADIFGQALPDICVRGRIKQREWLTWHSRCFLLCLISCLVLEEIFYCLVGYHLLIERV